MASISFTPVVLAHHKRRNGAYNLKIRVTFKRKSSYFSTSVMVYPSDLTKNMELKGTEIKLKAMALVKELNDAVGDLTLTQLESMDVNGICDHIRRVLNPESFRLDFLEYTLKQAAKKPSGTALCYRSMVSALKRYTGRDALDISEINVRFLRGFETFLGEEANYKDKKEKKGRKVSQYLGAVHHIHNLARLEFNEPDTGIMRIPINPFDYYRVPAQKAASHRNKSVEFIQKMIDARSELKGRERLGVDVFLLSFALMGMNSPDLYEARPLKNGVIHYNRTKTRGRRGDDAEMRVKVEKCIAPLVDEYADPSGERLFNFHERYASFNGLTVAVNTGLRSWAKGAGEDAVTLYNARHSFATIAHSSKCGVDKSTVDECLCHASSMKMADIYIAKDWEVLFQANRKVLALFDWSPLQKV